MNQMLCDLFGHRWCAFSREYDFDERQCTRCKKQQTAFMANQPQEHHVRYLVLYLGLPIIGMLLAILLA